MTGPGKWHYIDDSDYHRHPKHKDTPYDWIDDPYMDMSGVNSDYLKNTISELIRINADGQPVRANIIADSLEKKFWHYRFSSRDSNYLMNFFERLNYHVDLVTEKKSNKKKRLIVYVSVEGSNESKYYLQYYRNKKRTVANRFNKDNSRLYSENELRVMISEIINRISRGGKPVPATLVIGILTRHYLDTDINQYGFKGIGNFFTNLGYQIEKESFFNYSDSFLIINEPPVSDGIKDKRFTEEKKGMGKNDRERDVRDLKRRGYSSREIRDMGYSLEEASYGSWYEPLIKAGYTPHQLYKRGHGLDGFKQIPYTLKELVDDNFTVSELESLNYSADELKDYGFDLRQLKTCFNANQLRIAGFTLEDFKNEGFKTEELKKAHYTAEELKTAGYSLKELKAGGYDPRDLGCGISTLKDLGYTANQLKHSNYNLKEIIDAGYNLWELKEANYPAIELIEAGYSLSEVAPYKFPLAGMKKHGYDAKELMQFGYDEPDLKEAGFSIEELIDVGYCLPNFLRAGFTIEELLNCNYSPIELKNEGVDIYEFVKLHYTAKELCNIGFNLSELIRGGYSVMDLLGAGFELSDLRIAGFTANYLKSIGFSAKDLRPSGYTFNELVEANYGAMELKNAGFTAGQLRNVGFKARDLKDTYSDRELLAAGFKMTEIDQFRPGKNNVRTYR